VAGEEGRHSKEGVEDEQARPRDSNTSEKSVRVALYARVSTDDQTAENQLLELRRYVEARDWTAVEYVDQGVSGAKEHRPALDQLMKDAKRRRFDVLVCWRRDRLGRNLKHLITLLDELQTLGVAFVSLAEGIDATTPAGKLQMHILGAIAEFERERIRERVLAGLRRAQGARSTARTTESAGTDRTAQEGRRAVYRRRSALTGGVPIHPQTQAATGSTIPPGIAPLLSRNDGRS
jgi:DNA invertase Pin-like site-specific DNA recombinase